MNDGYCWLHYSFLFQFLPRHFAPDFIASYYMLCLFALFTHYLICASFLFLFFYLIFYIRFFHFILLAYLSFANLALFSSLMFFLLFFILSSLGILITSVLLLNFLVPVKSPMIFFTNLHKN